MTLELTPDIIDITEQHHALITAIVQIFETGTPHPDYGYITTLPDGPRLTSGHNITQLTYGRLQTTEYSHLQELLLRYVEANGSLAHRIEPFIDQCAKPGPQGKTLLAASISFRQLLKAAGLDSTMRECQDALFDQCYWQPAYQWFKTNGFTLPLSMLVIFDSFVHSGCILSFLRKRFSELTPVNGGKEKKWITQYLHTRHQWLTSNTRTCLQRTTYRTTMMLEQTSNNWQLDQFPLLINGVTIPAPPQH